MIWKSRDDTRVCNVVFYTLCHVSKALGWVTLSGQFLYVHITVYLDMHKIMEFMMMRPTALSEF